MGMTQEDYTTIMKTLSGNLAESGQEEPPLPPSPPPPAVAPPPRTDKSVDKAKDAGEKALTVKAVDKSPTAESSANAYVFSFKLDEIAALLYSGSSNLVWFLFLRELIFGYFL